MNTPVTPLPPELEADLLDVIEGRPLAPAARARVEACLREDPQLAAQVASMRADRALIAAGLPAAPAGLLEAVEQALEREALLGLARSEARVAAPIPVQRIEPIRVSVFRRPMTRALAVAAGLAVVSGVAWVMTSSRPGRVQPDGGAALALNRATPSAEPARQPMALSMSAPQDEPAALADVAAGAPAVADQAATLDALEADAAAPAAMPIAEAARLAGEGRLLIRVRGLDRDRLSLLARADARRPASAARWLDADTDQSGRVLAAAAAAAPRPSALAAAETGPDVRSVAGDRAPRVDSSRAASPSAAVAPSAPLPPPRVLLAAVPPTDAALSALRAQIEAAGGRVTLEALPAALPIDLPRDPLTILWWTLPPEAWTPPVAVPVLAE